jgi:hypothetical protein
MGLNKRLIDQAGGGGFSADDNFDELFYGGNGTARSFTTGFQPDLVWVKSRKMSYSHCWTNSIQGTSVNMSSDLTSGEVTNTNRVTSFNSDGFSVGTDSLVNNTVLGNNYTAFAWKAGGAAVSNTNGTITSQVSANVDAGFSIVDWTTTSSTNQRAGHGLSATPELIIHKQLNNTSNWFAFTTVIDSSYDYLLLNTADRKTDASSSDLPTSTTFSTQNFSSNWLTYCFHSVDAYQKIGTYVGNGSSVSVTTGFQPRMIFCKNSTYPYSANWFSSNASRSGYWMMPNKEEGEGSSAVTISFNSTGFTINSSNDTFNQNGGTFFYYAVA